MKLTKGSRIYFMGIGGTGMASVAGLCQEAGYQVFGSDKGVYPPMSQMLEALKIPYKTPYSPHNLDALKPDLIIVANALSRGNEELEKMLAENLQYTSFPAFLGENILRDRSSIVVSGTHGKTTTTSLCAYILDKLHAEPGYLIGGIPRDFEYSFRLGKPPFFVIEGDEYDTAFFDKGPKFLHYKPDFVILNNLEFDHADIFKNLEEIEAQFLKLCALVKDPRCIIANADNPGIHRLLSKAKLLDQVSLVATLGKDQNARLLVRGTKVGEKTWSGHFFSKKHGEFTLETQMNGSHNIANLAQVLCLLEVLCEKGLLSEKVCSPEKLTPIVRNFSGVKRRLDRLGEVSGIEVFEDFAHHPTAIKLVIEGFRKTHPNKELIVAFEPANASSRRNVFQDGFAEALSFADSVLIGKCPVDLRIPEHERMNTKDMAETIGSKAIAFAENEALLDYLKKSLRPNSAVIFMSPSPFSGIQHKLIGLLQERFASH